MVPYTIDIKNPELSFERSVLQGMLSAFNQSKLLTETFVNGIYYQIQTGHYVSAFRHGEKQLIEEFLNKFYIKIQKRRVLIEKYIK